MSILLFGNQIVSAAVAAVDNLFSRGNTHPFLVALSGIGGGAVGLGGFHEGMGRRFFGRLRRRFLFGRNRLLEGRGLRGRTICGRGLPGGWVNQAVIPLVDFDLKIMPLIFQLFDFPERLVLADAKLMCDFFNILIAVRENQPVVDGNPVLGIFRAVDLLIDLTGDFLLGENGLFWQYVTDGGRCLRECVIGTALKF